MTLPQSGQDFYYCLYDWTWDFIIFPLTKVVFQWVKANKAETSYHGLKTLHWLAVVYLCNHCLLTLCVYVGAKSLQSCLTLCDPMDCSLPGSSVHGIFQAIVLEWIAIPSPVDLPDPGMEPRSPALQTDSLLAELQGSLNNASWNWPALGNQSC